jgi:cell division protease FtsH
MENQSRFNFIYMLIAIGGIMLMHDLWMSKQVVDSLAYSDFQTLVKEGKVKEIAISGNEISGELKEPKANQKRFFRTVRVDVNLAQDLSKYDVKFKGKVESMLLPTLISWIAPTLLFFAVWLFLVRRMSGKLGAGGGLMSIGKSKAKVYVEKDIKVTFSDVAGVDEAKAELVETVNFLKNPAEYGRLGARMPKGILLVGPPGTGKTLLAKAVAGEAGVPFFSMSGSDFVEMFVGVGAARVRDLFEQARKQAPAIIFIDELDALGRARNSSAAAGGHDEKEQTLNQLLVEMDGFDTVSGLVLVAATNRPEILDPALLRAGRFDRQVLVDRPDKLGRVQILQVHVQKIRLGSDVDLQQVAALTPGFTGADLANLVNEAALAATRRGAEETGMVDFNAGVERIVAGLERRNRVLNSKEREIVAYHEVGHAIVASAIAGCDPVHKISIIPRGIGALGYTIQRPTEDRYLMTRGELENRMAVLMGGRAAEYLIYGHLSTGAADDLGKVTDIARSIVARYGMDLTLGHVAFDTDQRGFLGGEAVRQRSYSEATAREIDCAVRMAVSHAFSRALEILTSNRVVLERSALRLLELETLDAPELNSLFQAIRPAANHVSVPPVTSAVEDDARSRTSIDTSALLRELGARRLADG